METVGESPALLDSTQLAKTSKSMTNYLVREGFFDHHVRFEVKLKKKKKKAAVRFFVQVDSAYRIGKYQLNVENKRIKNYLNFNKKEQLVSEGDRFDIDQLEKERSRITALLRDRGYHFFKKDYVHFDVDTTSAGRDVAVTMNLYNPTVKEEDSLLEGEHQRYQLQNIYIVPDHTWGEKSTQFDTLEYNGVTFLYHKSLRLNPKLLMQHVFIEPKQIYRHNMVYNTYKRLVGLGIFKTVNIEFEEVGGDEPHLNCFMYLTRNNVHSLSFESKGTITGVNQGLFASVAYSNRNLFRGAETLSFGLTGGVEAQKAFTEDKTDASAPTNYFNTVEFGPELSLTFPKFLLPFRPDKFAKTLNPQTTFKASYGYENRPDYNRKKASGYLSYTWSPNDKRSHNISPLEVSAIGITKSAAFDARLHELNDTFLLSRYNDHLIASTKYSQSYTSTSNTGNLFYMHHTVEAAGNVLNQLHKWTNAQVYESGSYRLFNIRYAQFYRYEGDFRYHVKINERSTLASRIAGGVGYAHGNLNVMPFERSFYSGGTTGIRAWKARTLGPGSYFDLLRSFDKLGDIKLEGNVEYRFDLIQVLEGAFFLDVGNIWTMRAAESRPGGEFKWNSFHEEIAFGGGIGLRVDLSFFIISFDTGLQLKDPSMPRGERWLWQPKTFYNDAVQAYNAAQELPSDYLLEYLPKLNFNLGIGYPF